MRSRCGAYVRCWPQKWEQPRCGTRTGKCSKRPTSVWQPSDGRITRPRRCRCWATAAAQRSPPLPRHPAEAKSGGSTSPAAKEPELTWIEIQIVDEDGQPLSGETYQFTKTDGAMAQGTTSGTALRADQIPAGKCKLKLPDLHKNGWTGHGKTR